VEDFSALASFDCGDADLNEFFRRDALAHRKELLAETYSLCEDTAGPYPVALMSLANDAALLKPLKDRLDLPPEKQYPARPAVKIARFAVHRDFQGRNTGPFALNMLKYFFRTDNRTGCRLITVDAYNREPVLRFYGRNGFQFFHDKDANRQTRVMYFDLKRLALGL
jgi:GNAT superfamily N-acetyltransferase